MSKPIEVNLITPVVRFEDLSVLVTGSTTSVLKQIEATVEATETHRYKTIVSVEKLD